MINSSGKNINQMFVTYVVKNINLFFGNPYNGVKDF
jgi:hypothetical protein